MNGLKPVVAYVRAPTRTETLKFEVKLDKAGIGRHAKALDFLGFSHLFYCAEGDTGYATYSLNVEYFGEVEAKLKALAILISDPGLVTEASIEELEHGESLLVGIVEQIGLIRALLEGRTPAIGPRPGPWTTLRDWWRS